MSLLAAQIDTNPSDPLYLTADLAQVYTDTDPRTYELAYYSYMIVPTDLTDNMTTDKGYTLGEFGQYLLCTGQQQVDVLGYSALPVNLAEDNPAFSSDGTNTLANDDPMPPACDQQGPTQCAAATPTSTITTLTATPSPATVGQTVTLTAAVTNAFNTPVGSVQFEVDGTTVDSPVPLTPTGVAAITTTFAATGTAELSAVFTPTDDTAFNASTGTASLTVSAAPANAGTIPLAVTVPVTGTFSLTVDTTDTVTLQVRGNLAMAATTPIVVSDTRNTFPGWSVSGQAADFTGLGAASGAIIPAYQLGWQPTTTTSLGTGVTLGSDVLPAPPGLDTPAVLASAVAGGGYGTSTLGANLTLLLQHETAAGDYNGSLTVNAITALP